MAKLVRIMWIPVLVVGLYTGWVLWRRHLSLAQPPAQAALDPLAKYGSQLKVIQFYSRTGTIAPGAKAVLCYGVVNAKEVRLEPPVEKVWPSVSRCFDVAPEHSTRYTLTAESADHKTAAESLDIRVETR